MATSSPGGKTTRLYCHVGPRPGVPDVSRARCSEVGLLNQNLNICKVLPCGHSFRQVIDRRSVGSPRAP